MRREYAVADRVQVIGRDRGALASYDVAQLVQQSALQEERFGERIDWRRKGRRDGRRHDRAGGGTARSSKAIPVPFRGEPEPFDMIFLINALPLRAGVGRQLLAGNSLPTWRKLPGVASTPLA
jgi:hypothetical protein